MKTLALILATLLFGSLAATAHATTTNLPRLIGISRNASYR